MPQYDFKNLSPIDFEILVRDLLQVERSITLESFKAGKDKGIDFRYSPSKDNTLIVQCKHYAVSGYSKLRSDLKKKELPKVIQLDPHQYILATSVPLSKIQKDEIQTSFHPFIRNTGDIYGKKDLNNLLGKFSEIERRTIKLWIGSTAVLEELLSAETSNLSRDEFEHIQKRAEIYVQNKSMKEALDILDKNNYCVIAGSPGIGKTILAEMLILQFSQQGYRIIKISRDIIEAQRVDHTKGNILYYYDDFLGQTSYLEKSDKNEDQRLVSFLETIARSKGSKLILTTREYILNQARQKSEKLDRFNFEDKKCIVDLSKYTRASKAEILYNHLYFSNLPISYKHAILNDENYLTIVDHQNYSPRIIEMMTQLSQVNKIEEIRYAEFFIENLDNPFLLWQKLFDGSLTTRAKNLLVVRFTLPKEVNIDDLHTAFSGYHQSYSERFNTTTGPEDFRLALKELIGDFIHTRQEDAMDIVEFKNPSIRDFLDNYLASSVAEIELISRSMVFYEQLRFLWHWKYRETGRGVLLNYVHDDVDEFCARIYKLMEIEPCQLIQYADSNRRTKDNWSCSLERRVALVVKMINEGSFPVRALLKRLLHKIENKLPDVD